MCRPASIPRSWAWGRCPPFAKCSTARA
jgi:hypothetical protein